MEELLKETLKDNSSFIPKLKNMDEAQISKEMTASLSQTSNDIDLDQLQQIKVGSFEEFLLLPRESHIYSLNIECPKWNRKNLSQYDFIRQQHQEISKKLEKFRNLTDLVINFNGNGIGLEGIISLSESLAKLTKIKRFFLNLQRPKEVFYFLTKNSFESDFIMNNGLKYLKASLMHLPLETFCINFQFNMITESMIIEFNDIFKQFDHLETLEIRGLWQFKWKKFSITFKQSLKNTFLNKFFKTLLMVD